MDKIPAALGGVPLEIVIPTSLAERWEIVILGQEDGTRPRAMAAALGASWPRFRRLHRYTGNPLAYGEIVLNTLLAQGVAIGDILAAGAAAYGLITEALVDIGEARTFSAPPAAGPTVGGESNTSS